MLRLVVLLAIIVLSGRAYAQVDEAAEGAKVAAEAAKNIANSGLIGSIAILGLCAAGAIIVVLWMQNRALLKDTAALRDKRGDEADARAERFATVAESSRATGEEMVEAMRELTKTGRDVLDVVKVQPAANEAMIRAIDRNDASIRQVADKVKP